MTSAQTHRGPDDEGFESFLVPAGCLALGFRRLAILDLTPAGHQPMTNPRTGDWIVFNGEIYNYLELRRELEAAGVVFRSRCDTEVILHAFERWGTDAFDRLHGMFALGLYAHDSKQLILARDPLGIKPLYYAWGADAFVFASEVRAVVASGLVERDIDTRALGGLLAYGAVQSPLTIFRNIRALEAGSWAVLNLAERSFRSRQLHVVRYWDFPRPMAREQWHAGDTEAILPLLSGAVQSHLNSDVPLGVLLSSGLDSTAVAILAAEVRAKDIDTFTVVHRDFPELNEGPIAGATARAIGSRHHEISLSEAECRSQLLCWLQSLDQPSVDGFNTYIVSKAVRDRGIIVALSGLGGDEVFGGYSTFREAPWLTQAGRWVPRWIRRRSADLLYRLNSRSQRFKAAEMASAEPSLVNMYFRRRRLLADVELWSLGVSSNALDLDENFLPPESEPLRGLAEDDLISSVGVLEARYYLGNMLLRDSDVFSMAHGLELRVPMLDRQLTDRMFSAPGKLRVSTKRNSKPALVRAMGGRFNPELLKLKKRGFNLPQSYWMSGPMNDLFRELIHKTEECGLLEPTAVRAVWEAFLAEPHGTAWSRAWMLGILGFWLTRHHEMSVATAAGH